MLCVCQVGLHTERQVNNKIEKNRMRETANRALKMQRKFGEFENHIDTRFCSKYKFKKLFIIHICKFREYNFFGIDDLLFFSQIDKWKRINLYNHE